MRKNKQRVRGKKRMHEFDKEKVFHFVVYIQKCRYTNIFEDYLLKIILFLCYDTTGPECR